MSIKLKPLFQTAIFVSTMVIAALIGTSIMSHVTVTQFLYGVIGLFFVYLLYIYYTITLSQLEYKEKLAKMVDEK